MPDAPTGQSSSSRPTFSVVMAAYRASATVAEALESALSQEPPPVEVIVAYRNADDDNLEGALERFADRVVLLRDDDSGAPAALNAAIDRAHGDFVVNLDADDVFLPGYLERLGELGRRRPDLDLLASDLWIERAGVTPVRFFSQETPFPLREQRQAMLERCFVLWPAMRRDLVLRVGGLDPAVSHAYDWDLFLRLVLAGGRVGLVDEPLWVYRQRDDSMAADRSAMLRGRLTVLERAARDDTLSSEERRHLENLITAKRRDALLSEAEVALLDGASDARRRSVEVARAPGMVLSARLKALLAALMPGLAARRLRQQGPTLRTHRRLPPSTDGGE